MIGTFPRDICPTLEELASLHDLWREHPRFDGCTGLWLFNEGAGPTLYDNANVRNMRGTLLGAPAWETALRGQALRFAGNPDRVSLDVNGLAELDPATSYTWIFRATSDSFASWRCLMSIRRVGVTVFYVYAHTTTNSLWGPVTQGVSVGWENNSSNRIFVHTTDFVLEANTHYVVAVQYDASKPQADRFRIYVDGEDVTDLTDIVSQGSIASFDVAEMYLGNDGYSSGYHQGLMYDSRMYERMLTHDEILSVSAQPSLEYDWAFEQKLHHLLHAVRPPTAVGPSQAVGTSSGVATVAGLGRARIPAVASSDGVATVAGTGRSVYTGVGASAGIATTTGVGRAIVQGVGASAGNAATTGVGRAIVQGVGASAGVATVTGFAPSASGAGFSAGAATVLGVGAAQAQAVATSDGAAITTGVGRAKQIVTASSVGEATVAALGLARAQSVGTSTGLSLVMGVAEGGFPGVGVSQGQATVLGVGRGVGTIVGTGNIAGQATVFGIVIDAAKPVTELRGEIDSVPVLAGTVDAVPLLAGEVDSP